MVDDGRVPLTRVEQLDGLDDAEVIEGYHDGRAGEPEPGDNRSLSYWHGWRNGSVDGKHRQIDAAGMELARSVVASWKSRAKPDAQTPAPKDEQP